MASPEFYFAREAFVSAGKNVIFRYNKGYKQRLSRPVAKRREFSDLFPGLEFLNEAEKEKNNGLKRKLGISAVTIRFTVRGKNAILTERHSGKTTQFTNWSVSSFKQSGTVIKFDNPMTSHHGGNS